MRTRPVSEMVENLHACPPIPDVADTLLYGRTSCSGQTAAVGHSTYRHPIELLAAPGRVVKTFLAIDPGPAMATPKLRKRRPCPWRLPLDAGAAATSQPCDGAGVEVGRLAAHGTNVERSRKIPSPTRPMPDHR